MQGPRIRPAVRADLEPLTEIYNHYVATAPATFDTRPATVEERRGWFEQHTGGPYRLWVAAPDSGPPVGWAETGKFRPRPAYDTTVEVSVYLAPGWAGRGLGSRLYRALFDSIAGERLHRAVAVIALPNPSSVALHSRWGFREVGRLPEVGWKFGRYWDVGLFSRPLGPGPPRDPAEVVYPSGRRRAPGGRHSATPTAGSAGRKGCIGWLGVPSSSYPSWEREANPGRPAPEGRWKGGASPERWRPGPARRSSSTYAPGG